MPPALPVWKLTRTAPARRLYDALASAGLRVSVLDQFHRNLSTTLAGPSSPPAGVDIRVVEAAERPADWDVADPGLEPSHRVLGAVADGDLVGLTLLSPGGPVYVEPLEATLEFGGGYLWGVEVDPAWRRRGIASALVSAAVDDLRDVDASTACALVAPDNVPSRRLFGRAGFEPERRHVYIDAFGFERRSSRILAGEDSREVR